MYKLIFSIVAAMIVFGGSSYGQETAPATAETRENSDVLETYTIQLSEYRPNDSGLAARTYAEIVALLTNSSGEKKHDPVETIHLSTTSGSESMVTIGKQVTVTIDVAPNPATLGRRRPDDPARPPTQPNTDPRPPDIRRTQLMDLGTTVRITATPLEEKVLLKLAYESSRHAANGPDDSPPDRMTTKFETTQLLDFDKPTLICGTTAGSTSFILLTVKK